MHRSLIIASAVLGAFMALPGHSQEIDIKAATDGRCDYWLPMLRENPNETVLITLNDQGGSEIKLLVNGDRWRQVLLTGEGEMRLGCTFMEGQGVMDR